MLFSETIGNDVLKKSLIQMVQSNRLSHAILFCEENGGGAFALASALAQYVNCRDRKETDSCGVCSSCHKYGKLIHPDLHFAFPVSTGKDLSDSEKKAPISDYFLRQFRELAVSNPYFTEQDLYEAIGIEAKNSNISVNESKRIFDKLSLRAAEGTYKVMIIFLPEKMNADAANKLLKIIEEPPVRTLFLLISHNPERILKTIRSRCQRIDLKPLSTQERISAGAVQDNPLMREKITAILDASLRRSIADIFPLWEDLAEAGREQQKEFCLYAESFLRKIFLASCGMETLAEPVEEERALINEFAGRIRKDSYEMVLKAFDKVLSDIGSNVNSKLVFCDLCNYLLLTL
ncbi:MAG: hypothetical protein KBT00_05225 [Bacteroidales bacterium]|nr:hypothetical protein [Candidatus Cacconaster merdequi]